MNLSKLVLNIVTIARGAGKEIMKIYQTADFGIQYKSDESPVTTADQASNDFIIKKLKKLTPDIPIVSEESKEIPFSERQNYEYFWMIDPLDGTKEFIARNGDFAVNIALIFQNKPILGIIFVPNTGGVYFAVKNEGSFKVEVGKKTKITCNSFSLNDLGLRIPVSRSYFNEATKKLIADNYRDPVLLPRGSALKFMNIAEGSADIYPRIGTTMEWDTAACQIIIEEAGGQILEMSSKLPLKYNKPSLFNPDFIALGIVHNG
jgi:3'(2'), 5'-bisphosphate nucleotidase